jgi:predicted metal-dependent hydrolase
MNEIPYKIVRSNRKSIALVVDSDANLVVRAPQNATESVIVDFVEKKKRWITEKQQQVAAFGEKHSPVIFKSGESILYLGNTYTILKGSAPAIQFSSSNILIPEEYLRDDVIAWMKDEAEKMLIERVSRYAGLMGVTYASVRLSEAKVRWGSCGKKNNLNFAWRLIMCPIAVIDYVVVHELSHIAYKNHSSSFWARVKTVLPNYKEQQDWLKVNRKLMEIIC